MLNADCWIQKIENEGEYVKCWINISKSQTHDGKDITLGKFLIKEKEGFK